MHVTWGGVYSYQYVFDYYDTKYIYLLWFNFTWIDAISHLIKKFLSCMDTERSRPFYIRQGPLTASR